MKEGGFTLVELLVIIAIVGILSSVAVVNLQSSKDKASKAMVLSSLAMVQRAAALCAEDKQELSCSGITCNGRPAFPPASGQPICNGSTDVWPSFDEPDIEWYVAESDINTTKEFCFEIAWNDYDLIYVNGGNWSEQYSCDENGCNDTPVAGSNCAGSMACSHPGQVCVGNSDCCGALICDLGVCTPPGHIS